MFCAGGKKVSEMIGDSVLSGKPLVKLSTLGSNCKRFGAMSVIEVMGVPGVVFDTSSKTGR